MIEGFVSALKDFSAHDRYIECALLVGSYARGTNREDSDVDVILLTPNKPEMVRDQSFVRTFGKVDRRQTEYYGACTSIRVWYAGGLEVEFGLVEPSWIQRPLDPGTKRVLSDGYVVVIDKKDYFKNLALSADPPRW